MSQPEISPLARRLAEENNVDWRGLHGSGAGGKVVERDVLEFLARVMAGEEDLDPTPEPVPEGMHAWPDEDVRSFQDEVRESRRDAGLDEIQQELSAADRLAGDPRGEEAGVGGMLGREAIEDEDSGDEAIDLEGIDTGPTEVEGPDAGRGPSRIGEDRRGDVGGDLGGDVGGDLASDVAADADAGSRFAGDLGEDIDEDIFLFGDDEEPAPAEEPGSASAWSARSYEDSEDELLVAGEDGPGGVAAEEEGARPSEDAVFAGDTATSAPGDLPDVFDAGEAPVEEEEEPPAADAALFADEAASEDEELEMPSLGDVGQAEEEPGPEEGGVPFPFGGPGEERQPWTGEDADGEWATGAWSAGEASAEDVAAERGAPEAWGPDATEGEPAREPLGDAGWGVGEPEAAEVDDALAPDTSGAVGTSGVSVPRELPLVSYGTLLRRHLDVTALAGAQLAVSLELGESEPLSPAPFLVRAAAKAVQGAHWGDGSVAMVGFDEAGNVRSRRIEEAAQRPFVELARLLAAGDQDGPGGDTGAALSVVDMSALDVDEAVLDVGGPLLTLGRILYDNQRGSYRSTLSLTGELSAERGARLLARVAELLDAPVRLVV